MNADYGGTSIRSALEKVLSSSDTQLPTACFVLTDGEVSLLFRCNVILLECSSVLGL